MKNLKENNMIALVVIAVIVVMVTALSLTLNGSSFMGYLNLRSVAPTNYDLRVNPAFLPKPLSPEPKPQSPEPVPANQAINRAELAKLIVDAKKAPINTSGGPHFPDVATGVWYYPYVETAYNNGWMAGYPDGTFKPGNSVNRAEAAKIFTLSILMGCSATNTYPVSPYYKDVTLNDWFYGAVQKMADCKMVDILPSTKSNYWPSYLLSKGRAQYMVTNAKKAGWIQ